MKNFIKTVLATSLMFAGVSLQAAEAPMPQSEREQTVKLLLDDQEYFVPKDVVKQAKTIAQHIEEFGEEDNIQVGEQVTPAAMDKIKQIMWVIHGNDKLRGKALLNAIEKKVIVNDAIIFDLLRTSNYLEFQPAIDFVAKKIARESNLIARINNEKNDQEQLPNELIEQIAQKVIQPQQITYRVTGSNPPIFVNAVAPSFEDKTFYKKIYIAGYSNRLDPVRNRIKQHGIVARYDENNILDTTFAGNGIFHTGALGERSTVNFVEELPNKKIKIIGIVDDLPFKSFIEPSGKSASFRE